jgi:ribosomal protein L24E
MPTCSFCKRSFNAPRGLTVFQFNGKAVHFCSSKCRKNSALKRDPKKVNWIRKNSEVKEHEKQKDNSE